MGTTEQSSTLSNSFISTQCELEAFVARAGQHELLAIDTEFMREKTYYPQLCLLQMANEEEAVIVDPFALGSLEALKDLFEDARIVKLFHAGSQDIEIIFHELGIVPKPLFDTQIAAALLGHTLQVGYAPLVQSVCGVKLKKSDSFTDWSRRPLTKSQISYAAEDVIYLPTLYRSMKAQLENLGRLSWLDPEFAALASPERYLKDPYTRFRKLKRVNQLSRKQLSAARELAAWREHEAMQRNIPRKWILSDEQVVEACRRNACSIDQLLMVRGVSEKLDTEDARAACTALATGFSLPESAWPSTDKPSSSEANVDALVDALCALVRVRAKEHGIAFHAIASHADLVSVARGKPDSDVLKGWRRDIVGNDLVDFVSGKLLLSADSGSIKVTKRE